MIRKLRLWWMNRQLKQPETSVEQKTYTYEQVKKVYNLGYNDGRRDGLALAREEATKSLQSILKVQNKE